jgi:hypothetical protein
VSENSPYLREDDHVDQHDQHDHGDREGPDHDHLGDRFLAFTPRDEARALLVDPPDWLAPQLDRLRTDPALMRPTCSAISSTLYGTSERRDEVRPFVEEWLRGGAA